MLGDEIVIRNIDIHDGVVPPGFAEAGRPIALPLGGYRIEVQSGGVQNFAYFNVTTANRIR